jgi:hypothetical protein
MANFIEQEDFIDYFYKRLLDEKVINIKLNVKFNYILQIINIIYCVKLDFVETKIPVDNEYIYFYTIYLIDENENI